MLDQKDLEMITQIVDKVVGSKMKPLEDKIDSLEKKVDSLEIKIDSLEKKVDSLEIKFDSLEKKVDSQETKISTLDYNVRDIKMTLENETIKQIKIIAEGHSVLNRKLDKALEINNEREILKLRLVHLENEIRQVKESLTII